MLCSNLHCQILFDLTPFSYQISKGASCTPPEHEKFMAAVSTEGHCQKGLNLIICSYRISYGAGRTPPEHDKFIAAVSTAVLGSPPPPGAGLMV